MLDLWTAGPPTPYVGGPSLERSGVIRDSGSSASVEESHYRGLARSLIESLPLFRSLRVQEAVGQKQEEKGS